MNDKKINEIYDDFENIVMTNFYGYSMAIFGVSVATLAANMNHVTPSTLIPFVATIPASMALCASNINPNGRKYKEEHKSYKFSTNMLKLDKDRKEALKHSQNLDKMKHDFKKNYVQKCEEIKKEIIKPVHADLSYGTNKIEKVKVKTYKRR